MVLVVGDARHPLQSAALRAMFEARKRVFVDLLKWDVPVLGGRFEVDQFDDEHAIYLIVAGRGGAHLASARLLKTTRPHILDTLFPGLCAGPPVRSRETLEITRFCLDRGQRGQGRLEVRNRLVAGLVDYALGEGIERFIGVAELGWLQQILAFGWRCHPLGLPQTIGKKMLGAFSIEISAETPALLAQGGIYSPQQIRRAAPLETA